MAKIANAPVFRLISIRRRLQRGATRPRNQFISRVGLIFLSDRAGRDLHDNGKPFHRYEFELQLALDSG
jgi:hypothetical protein